MVGLSIGPTSVRQSLGAVRARIAGAARRSGRDPGGIRLVVVSKGRPPALVREAISAGATEFGENRATEFVSKREAIGDVVVWHFVGHLQRNKVKLVVPIARLIHSVDRVELAVEIDKRARAVGKHQEILVEVNVGGEPGKFGLRPEEAPGAIEQMARLPNLAVRGLMTMAPLVRDPEETRPVFARLKRLFDELLVRFSSVPIELLSMGMSADFEVAVEEGSNMVRIGTAIFEGVNQGRSD